MLRGQIPGYEDEKDALSHFEKGEKPFKPHYDEFIQPKTKRLEKKRVKVLKQLRKKSIIAIVLAIVLVSASVYLFIDRGMRDDWIFWAGLDFILLVFLLCWAYAPVWDYKDDIKKKIFPKVFSFFGPDFEYKLGGMRSIKALKPSGILPEHNRLETEDYVKGSYKDVTLELTEAKLIVRRRTKDGNQDRIRFQGILILLSMNKEFSCQTIVKKDAGILRNWFSDRSTELDNVSLEDPVFEKKFEVYSTDQVGARYLLTTSFMDRLVALSDVFGKDDIQCSFYDNKLLMMIRSKKNRFETSSVFRAATFTAEIKTILDEMREIFQIVDVLKLYQQTRL